ncbi:hypothetical protein Poli38472_001771 [Pythium oligandrum]|uniref:subtilisin n=1 Tax=Pythium oligandrum TaxID=41045 RepID=A0A8K1FMQ1_PYTOL|nr:hypothetical protein Poli38472_001771 [Pythium oligandrum]|eukprot:TMW69615.1 hypothetical protein Poli38472_001771 [Pythium oligandrum]
MVSTKFAALVLATALVASVISAAHVDPAVHRALRKQGTVNLVVTMKKGTKAAINAAKEASFSSREAQIESLVNRLQQNAEKSQVEVGKLFAKEAGGKYVRAESLWISNQVYIEGATVGFVESLATLPTIGEIREEEVYQLDEVTAVPANSTGSGNQWGIEMIQAPAVWATGNTGQGVVVGSIDTGVRGTHEILKGSFRGDYGWYDPEAGKPEPYDNAGHGSHTMGTIVGSNGFGVAPGATWMACKGCRTSSCRQVELLMCMQFMTCPTDPNGENQDCSKAPHVINNSWGAGARGSDNYKAAVDAWHAAGIIPIFSNGNGGRSGCDTASAPGEYDNVISVGATNSTDGLAEFSSKGVSSSGRMKPEISAPGKDVRSAWLGSDDGYYTDSGTSMAAPHVTGSVALLLSARPGLKFDEVRDILSNNVDTQSLMPTGYSCGNTVDGVFPNNMYGYGRLNAFKAVSGDAVGLPERPSPVPTTLAPAPTTPAPTTPAPSNVAPESCSTLGMTPCYYSEHCEWNYPNNKCQDKASTPAPSPSQPACSTLGMTPCYYSDYCAWDYPNKQCLDKPSPPPVTETPAEDTPKPVEPCSSKGMTSCYYSEYCNWDYPNRKCLEK